MDVDRISWTYGIAKTDGTLEAQYITGPISTAKMEELLGGPVEIHELRDGTAIGIRRDRNTLPTNPHYQGIRGDVLVGKVRDGVFVGAIGVPLG